MLLGRVLWGDEVLSRRVLPPIAKQVLTRLTSACRGNLLRGSVPGRSHIELQLHLRSSVLHQRLVVIVSLAPHPIRVTLVISVSNEEATIESAL